MNAIDLTGQRFGRLVVLEQAEPYRGEACWQCKCECGNNHVVRSSNLRGGKTKSCGCLARERCPQFNLKRDPILELVTGVNFPFGDSAKEERPASRTGRSTAMIRQENSAQPNEGQVKSEIQGIWVETPAQMRTALHEVFLFVKLGCAGLRPKYLQKERTWALRVLNEAIELFDLLIAEGGDQ